MRCRLCLEEVPEEAARCPSCAADTREGSASGSSGADPEQTGWTLELGATPASPPAESPPPAPAGSSGDPARRDRFQPGALLAGRYRIAHLVGRGGMGEVYRAEDLKLDQPVALKFLPESMDGSPAELGRLLDEVRLARQIAHPNVCRVYDIGEVGGLHFLSMELIEGEDLAQLLERIGRLPEDKALELGAQICDGLAAAHEQGILHRDLKPSNLMIDHRGAARIMDFGLASLADGLARRDLRRGTPAYMAPEQFEGREPSVASDLYALGLVLYRLLTGAPPFRGESSGDPARMHLEETPLPIAERSSGLDPQAAAVIMRCLEKEPSRRPASAREVGRALVWVEETRLRALVALAGAPGREPPVPLLDRLLEEHGGERSGGESLHLVFERPAGAVGFALALHAALRKGGRGEAGSGRGVGLHLAELSPAEAGAASPATRVAASLAELAADGQTLLTRGVFDLARQGLPGEVADLRWLAHGAYEIDGIPEPVEIFEVGRPGEAPLAAPAETAEVRRQLVQPTIVGWRPAPGSELPQRPHWKLERKLGEGGFGDVWLAVHDKTREHRVFKFCYDPESLRALKREITLFRLLKEELGDREDITRILDWSFQEPPYFIESEYTAEGSLFDFAAREGLESLPLDTRLEIVAQIAAALAAAHSVGVLHKDVKPGNVLLSIDREGRARARLSDFGLGRVTEEKRLLQAGITVQGLSVLPHTEGSESSPVGTRLYMAPELLEGRPATLQSDIYALGVMLYQMVVGDFSRALAPGWKRSVTDELLAEDIAAAVDGSPGRRLSDAQRLAERLRGLEERRRLRERERREAEEARAAREAVEASRKRNRLIAAASLVLSVVAGILAVQAHRIREEARATQAVGDFTVGLLELPERLAARGTELTMREVLERAEESVGRDIEDRPAIQAQIRHRLGVAYMGLGVDEKAAEQFGEALAIRKRVFGEGSLEVAQTLVPFASVLSSLDRRDEAEVAGRRALEIRRRLLPAGDPDIAHAQVGLGDILYYRKQYVESETYYRDALESFRAEDSGSSAGEANVLRNLATALSAQGALLEQQGEPAAAQSKHEEARQLMQEALAHFQEIYGADNIEVAHTLHLLGVAHESTGDLDQAIHYYREALERRSTHMRAGHPALVSSMAYLASALKKQGELDRATALFEEALESHRQGEGSERLEASLLMNLGEISRAQGQAEAVIAFSRQAVAIYRREGDKMSPRTSARIAEALARQAEGLLSLGRPEGCAELAEESLERYQDQNPPRPATVDRAELLLGRCLSAGGLYAEAEPRLLALYRRVSSREDEDSAEIGGQAVRELLTLYEAWGKTEPAQEFRRLTAERALRQGSPLQHEKKEERP